MAKYMIIYITDNIYYYKWWKSIKMETDTQAHTHTHTGTHTHIRTHTHT